MLCSIAERTKAGVIGITESKLDESIFQSEIQIDNYDLLPCDRNRNRGVVACYIRSDISYVQKDFFPNVIKNIFFEIPLPKTSPITVGILYRPPSQINFLEILNITFEKVDVDKKRYILLAISTCIIAADILFVMITQFLQSSCLTILKTITNFVRCMA